MDVFVYGTLTDPAQVRRVISASDFEFRGDAVLDGLHRVDGEYPTLAPGGSVSGRVLRTDDVAALDAYEGVESGLYVRVSVPRVGGGVEGESGDESEGGSEREDDGENDVAVYVGDPDALNADAKWPGEGPFAERVREFVRERGVVVRSRDRE